MLSRVDPTTLAEASEEELFGSGLDEAEGTVDVGADAGGIDEVAFLSATSDHPQDGAVAPAKWLEC